MSEVTETEKEKLIEEIRRGMCLTLDIDPDKPPIGVSVEQASKVLGVTVGTLNLWRSCGRYSLPYIKMGHLIRYPIPDLASFVFIRTHKGRKNAVE